MSHSLAERILEAAQNLAPTLTSIRRHLHQHPELSFEEFQTSQFIQTQLRQAGIEFTSGWVKTGVVAEISGNAPGKTLALRGDMDALPIQEENQVSYCSANPGVMHACGHDVHSTCVLGAAMLLKQFRPEWNGKVLFVFQPGEEKLPGGAKLMLEAGIFAQQKPDAMFALHVFPSLQAGSLGFRPGMYMASTDELYFTVTGKGGHAAMPHQVKDPIVAAAQLILSLQQVSSRLADPTIPTVLSIGKINAQGATNVIPDQVQLEGTFRTMHEPWRAEAHQHISRIAAQCAEMHDVEITVEIRRGYPVLVNDNQLTLQATEAAKQLLGDQQVHPLEMRLTAEDFAWFAQEYPVCFYRLGTQSANGAFRSGVHTSTFDIDESALVTGAASMAYLAMDFLNR